MDLPGLQESLKEMQLIGGNMDKPRIAKIEPLEDFERINVGFDLRKEFADQVLSLQTKFLEILEVNSQLQKENQRLRAQIDRVFEVLGG